MDASLTFKRSMIKSSKFLKKILEKCIKEITSLFMTFPSTLVNKKNSLNIISRISYFYQKRMKEQVFI